MICTIIISVILLGLLTHRYLTTFWELGILPYPMGFLVFATSFPLVYLISFIWMFGVIAGIVMTLLCFFQLVYCTILWIFSIPSLIKMHRSTYNYSMPKVNPFIYGSFSFLIITLVVLTIINFFVSPYASQLEILKESIGNNTGIFIGVVIGSNFLRIAIMSMFMDNDNLP